MGATRYREPCRVASVSHEQAPDSGNSWLEGIDASVADSHGCRGGRSLLTLPARQESAQAAIARVGRAERPPCDQAKRSPGNNYNFAAIAC